MKSAYPLDVFPTPDDYVGTLIEADLGMSARGIRNVAGSAGQL